MAKDITKTMSQTRNQVAKNLRNLVSEAEDLLAKTAEEGYEGAEEAISASLDNIDQKIAEARKQLDQYADESKKVVKRNPVQSVAIAVGVGVAIGWLLNQRD